MARVESIKWILMLALGVGGWCLEGMQVQAKNVHRGVSKSTWKARLKRAHALFVGGKCMRFLQNSSEFREGLNGVPKDREMRLQMARYTLYVGLCFLKGKSLSFASRAFHHAALLSMEVDVPKEASGMGRVLWKRAKERVRLMLDQTALHEVKRRSAGPGWTWSLVVLAGVSLAAGVVVNVSALQNRQYALDLSERAKAGNISQVDALPTLSALDGRSSQQQIASYALYGVAGGAATLALLVYLLAERPKSKPPRRVRRVEHQSKSTYRAHRVEH
ncbi:MAG: hypothetical protein AAGJ35_06445, partial [Myxococcota bacterium]